ncbi:MAG: HEPN domain-containing protein [Dehalococcoidia bacterium]|nr:HEPN domain-containing protein [Dehalococcoidia bacterium]
MIREQYVRDKFLFIKETINRIERFKGDSKIIADLVSYLVVLISGAYEDCFEHLLNKRAAKSGDIEIKTFVEKTLDLQLRNPNWDNLTTILGRFSKKWVVAMNKRIPYKAKTGLNNIVTNKNAVAHGSSSNMTLIEIKACHRHCKAIFEKLEKII